MEIIKFEVNPLGENCYILSDSGECVIIDCGARSEAEKKAIDSYIKDNKLKLTHVLNTHLHFDHVWGNNFLFDTYGLETEASGKDEQIYRDMDAQIFMFMRKPEKNGIRSIARYLEENDEIHFGSCTLKVIATPGHTPGSICFLSSEDKVLFSGDTLFRFSIGRTDLPGGNYLDMGLSLKKLRELDDDIRVYPGHGPMTTMKEEKEFNPYM